MSTPRSRLRLVCLAAIWNLIPMTAQAAEEVATAKPEPSLFQIIFSGGVVGSAIMISIFALSFVAAYLIFEQFMTLRRKEILPEGLADEVRQLLISGRLAEATQACRDQPSFLSFVLLAGLGEVEGGWAAVEKALEDVLAEQSARLFRKVEYLSVIGNIAPMLGLLGTVTGMILAFQTVAKTQGSANAAQLAEGIYEALVTTVGGLVVAIPAIGAFAVLRNRIDQLVAEAAYIAQHVFTPLKRRRFKAQQPASPPSSPPSPPSPPSLPRSPKEGGR